jgi:hypothetical protein
LKNLLVEISEKVHNKILRSQVYQIIDLVWNAGAPKIFCYGPKPEKPAVKRLIPASEWVDKHPMQKVEIPA